MQETDLEITSAVDEILSTRKQLLPRVVEQSDRVLIRTQAVNRATVQLKNLLNLERDPESRQRIHEIAEDLGALKTALDRRSRSLETLTTRFSRETLNIGVSGEARVGKSTTLQRFSGLTDVAVPTGDGLPVTAVRSEIYNSSEEFAEVTFRDQQAFFTQYVRPLLESVNSLLKTPITADSLTSFLATDLPQHLGNNVDSIASDSLSRLREVQRAKDTYLSLLTGQKQRVPLQDLRKFVAYPTNEEVREEESGRQPASRAYLAVQSVKIHTPFPRLLGAKIGLVDLPGLGEINTSIADMHLQGLEDNIDQIFTIMRPTESEGFVKQGIASNIDHLRRIQPAIQRRSDFITAGINVYEGLSETVESLRSDFERKINGAQQSDRIQVLTYCAAETNSTAEVLVKLLGKIAQRLRRMDLEVFEAATGPNEEADISVSLQQAIRGVADLARRLPLPDRQLNDQINQICASIVHEYNVYEASLSEEVGIKSDWHTEFEQRVNQINEEVERRLDDGFFLGKELWQASAHGRKDYYNWYRDECMRIRRELIAAYSTLDTFYEDRVGNFKIDCIEILLKNTHGMRHVFDFRTNEDPDSRLDKISRKLAATVPDPDMESALALLKAVHFSFRNNVFLQISKHLQDLSNPPETWGHDNVRLTLGSVGDIDTKIERLSGYLSRASTGANKDVRNALLKNDDRFHEYLSVCVSFFNDYLFRKDFENFKHVVIRGLIKEYRELILGRDTNESTDQKRDLIVAINSSLETASNGTPDAAMRARPRVAQPAPMSRPKPLLGERRLGQVVKIVSRGALVDVGGPQNGLVPKRSLLRPLEEGATIEVVVSRLHDDGKITLEMAEPLR